MKTILLFRTTFHPMMRQEYEPVFAFARTHGWQVQTIDYLNAAVTRHWTNASAPELNIAEILDFWKPDGCIVECGGIPHEPWENLFAKIPTVFLDRPQPDDDPDAICVSNDSKEVAALASKELLSYNMNDYAYIYFPTVLPWSENRGHWFQHFIQQHGKTYHSYRMKPPSDRTGRISDLANFLNRLPKPCGIFSANDENTRDIVNTCVRIGIRIPEDIVLVSVDNDLEICENLPVTVTSIELDNASSIVKAITLLDQLLTSKRKTVKSLTFGVKRIVRRASANGLREVDRRIGAALEYIRRNACNNIHPTDVARSMGCSIRLANLRFHTVRHNTILDEIHLRRIEIAKELLAAKILPIQTIAETCGYGSSTDFGRVFRRFTQMSPRTYRKKS